MGRDGRDGVGMVRTSSEMMETGGVGMVGRDGGHRKTMLANSTNSAISNKINKSPIKHRYIRGRFKPHIYG